MSRAWVVLRSIAEGTGARRTIDAATPLLAALAFGVSISSALLAHRSNEIARAGVRIGHQSARAELFVSFQEQFGSIAARFPADMERAQKRGTAGWDALRDYWILSYSEWFVTQELDPEAFGTLWNEFYQPRVTNSLGIPSFRCVLDDLLTFEFADDPSFHDFVGAAVGALQWSSRHGDEATRPTASRSHGSPWDRSCADDTGPPTN